MFASVPVSRLSTQITRWLRASSASQRWEPRNPAPPVTTEVDIGVMLPAPAAVPANTYRTRTSREERRRRRTASATAIAPAASSTNTNGSADVKEPRVQLR